MVCQTYGLLAGRLSPKRRKSRKRRRQLEQLQLGVFQRPLTLILLQKHRDTNGRRIAIQIGGVYTTFCQIEGILLQKCRDRNACRLSNGNPESNQMSTHANVVWFRTGKTIMNTRRRTGIDLAQRRKTATCKPFGIRNLQRCKSSEFHHRSANKPAFPFPFVFGHLLRQDHTGCTWPYRKPLSCLLFNCC